MNEPTQRKADPRGPLTSLRLVMTVGGEEYECKLTLHPTQVDRLTSIRELLPSVQFELEAMLRTWVSR